MNWNEVNDIWVDLNKEFLLSFFIDVVVPRFYSDKVLEKFKTINLCDIKIYTNYHLNKDASIRIEILLEKGNKNIEYFIVGRHISLYDLSAYMIRLKRDVYLEKILSDGNQ